MGYNVYFAMNGGLPLYSPVKDVLEIPDLDNYVPYKSSTETYSYEFGGWYYDDEFTSQALTGDPITGNIILHALWIETQIGGYSITFVANGGTPEPDNLTYQTAIPDPLPSISKAGFIFAGWRWGNTSESALVTPGELIYADATIYAVFTKDGYTIVYESNGGSAVSQTTGVNAFPSPLPTTTKAGSTFAGWWNSNFTAQYTAGQPIYGSLIAYAKWIVNSYTVTWVENGGTPAPDDLTDVASLPSPLPAITKTGYELDGWYFNSLFAGSAATPGQLITQNETLYAKFVRVSYVIDYELDGGTNNAGNPDEYNVETATITLLDPSKVGYTFNGWFSDEELTTPITSIPTGTTGDITIYASFTLSETGYSITWVENGGTPEQTDLTNQNYLPSVLPALIKTGYVFKGWFTNEALTIAAAPSAIIGENTTLYAKFEAQAAPKKGYIRVEPIDTALSATSKKPLQNKAIYTALALKFNSADLTREALVTLLGEATTSLNGLISATDKTRLDTIYASFNDTDENNVVDKISEILAIFENYPEADAIVTALSSKVDKTTTVNTKALSSNIVLSGADLLVGGSTSANAAALISVAFKTLEDVDDTKVDKVEGKVLSTNDYTDEEKAKLADIEDRIDVIESKIDVIGLDYKEYGVREVVGQSASEFERVTRFGGEIKLGSATGLVANVAIDDADVTNSFDYIPIFKREKVSVDATDLSSNVVSNTFVKVPKYYIKEEWVTESGTDYHYIFMSQFKHEGYRLPLPFKKPDGSERDYTYIGAYEAFLDGNNKLRSLTGKIPKVNYSRNNFRTAARALDGLGVKSKYQITDLAEYVDLVQIPFMIEFATKHSQGVFLGATSMAYSASHTAIAEGTGVNAIVVSNETGANFVLGQTVSIGTSNSDDSIAKDRIVTQIDVDTPNAGETTITFDGAAVNIAIGNVVASRAWKTGATDQVKVSGTHALNDGKHSIVWRGLENPFGNIWKNVDGVKISNWRGYVTENPKNYNDTASVDGVYAEPYLPLGYLNADTNNYAQKLGYDANYPYAKFPISVQASSGLFFRDYYYQNTEDRTVFVGGSWLHSAGSDAGLFFWFLNNGLGAAYLNIGARLSYRP